MVLDEQFRQARASAFEETRSGSAAAAGESAPNDSPAAPTSATSTAADTTVPTAVGTATATAVGAGSSSTKIPETATTYNSTTDVARLTESSDPPPPQSATASPSTTSASAAPSAQESEPAAGARAIDEFYLPAAPTTRMLSIQDTGLTPSCSPAVDIPFTPSHSTSSSTYLDPLSGCSMPETISSWCSGPSVPIVLPDDGTGNVDSNMFTAEDFTLFETLFQDDAGRLGQDASLWNPNILSQSNEMAYGNVHDPNPEGYYGNQCDYSSNGTVDSIPLLLLFLADGSIRFIRRPQSRQHGGRQSCYRRAFHTSAH